MTLNDNDSVDRGMSIKQRSKFLLLLATQIFDRSPDLTQIRHVGASTSLPVASDSFLDVSRLAIHI